MPNIPVQTARNGRSHATAKPQYAHLLAGFSRVVIGSNAEHFEGCLRHHEQGRPFTHGDLAAEASGSTHRGLRAEALFDERREVPLDPLKELMGEKEMQAKDLRPVFGSKGITSEVPNGKRGISREMAKKPGELFHVPP